jgi:Transcriptional Coactivator p15 (PC4)
MMDADSKIVFELTKNRREVIRLTTESYKGQALMSLRIWARYEDGTIRPTRQGLSVKPELFADLVAGLSKATQSNQGGA